MKGKAVASNRVEIMVLICMRAMAVEDRLMVENSDLAECKARIVAGIVAGAMDHKEECLVDQVSVASLDEGTREECMVIMEMADVVLHKAMILEIMKMKDGKDQAAEEVHREIMETRVVSGRATRDMKIEDVANHGTVATIILPVLMAARVVSGDDRKIGRTMIMETVAGKVGSNPAMKAGDRRVLQRM